MRQLIYVLLTGILFTYFSEWMFWAGQVPNPDPLEYLLTAALYSFAAFIFLIGVRYFRVTGFWAVFLAGALYGWLVEGIIVQTTYAELPLSISHTALSWHALLTIVFGWHYLRRWLRQGWRPALLGSIAFGFLLGVWSIGWWVEVTPGAIGAVIARNFLLTIPLVIAFYGLDRIGDITFQPRRWSIALGFALLAAYYGFVTFPTAPISIVLLPLLSVPVLLTLGRHRQQIPDVNPQTHAAPPVRYLAVLLIPTVSSLIYALGRDVHFETLMMVYVLTVPTGFALLLISLYRLWRKPVL